MQVEYFRPEFPIFFLLKALFEEINKKTMALSHKSYQKLHLDLFSPFTSNPNVQCKFKIMAILPSNLISLPSFGTYNISFKISFNTPEILFFLFDYLHQIKNI